MLAHLQPFRIEGWMKNIINSSINSFILLETLV